MPELPEVETVARGVAAKAVGLTIDHIFLNKNNIVCGDPAPLCAALGGRRIENVLRRGKQVHIELDDRLLLIVHLGMTGRLVAVDRDQPQARHTHLRITFRRRRTELRFVDPRRFGRLWLVRDRQIGGPLWIGRQPPPVTADPLTITRQEFILLMQRDRQIKALLLDQQPISGIGNIYCDEALHRAGIHPRTRANALPTATAGKLWQALRRVLTEAIDAGGSSVSDYRNADEQPGWFQVRHRVYNRAGQPCRKCRTPIVRTVTAGRGTFICPQCQPEPKNTAARKKRSRRRI